MVVAGFEAAACRGDLRLRPIGGRFFRRGQIQGPGRGAAEPVEIDALGLREWNPKFTPDLYRALRRDSPVRAAGAVVR